MVLWVELLYVWLRFDRPLSYPSSKATVIKEIRNPGQTREKSLKEMKKFQQLIATNYIIYSQSRRNVQKPQKQSSSSITIHAEMPAAQLYR